MADRYFRETYERLESRPEGSRAEITYFDALRKWSNHENDHSDALLKPLLGLPNWRSMAFRRTTVALLQALRERGML